MNRVKQPHIVPEFYLHFFTDSSGKIYGFDKPNFKDFESKPEKVAKKNGFYDLDGVSDLELKQVIETKLSTIEYETALIYKRLISRLENGKFNGLLDEERHNLSTFIFIQTMRTVGSRNMLEQFNLEFNQQLKEKFPEEFHDKIRHKTEDIDPKKLQLSILGSNIEEQSCALRNRIWFIHKNNTKNKFYTSDHPVCTYDHGNFFKMQHEIFFPLTPNYMLSLLDQNQFSDIAFLDNKIIDLNEEDKSNWYNCMIIFIAERQIYGNSSDSSFARKILTENPQYRLVNQKRIGGPDYQQQ